MHGSDTACLLLICIIAIRHVEFKTFFNVYLPSGFHHTYIFHCISHGKLILIFSFQAYAIA